MQTSFIGALASFETFFGALWGQGLPESRLSEQQRKWRSVWAECRNSVLNNGNTNLRAVEGEISGHSVQKDKKSIIFRSMRQEDSSES